MARRRKPPEPKPAERAHGKQAAQEREAEQVAKADAITREPGAVADRVGQQLGHDFSGVRVHTDSAAAQLALRHDARALTHGQDVYFGAGNYRPDTREGRHLIAHELTHVKQQSGGPPRVQRYDTHEHMQLGAIEHLLGPGEEEYKVKKGERIPELAKRFGMSTRELKARNRAKIHAFVTPDGHDVDTFLADETIMVRSKELVVKLQPGEIEYKVKKGERIADLAKRFGMTLDELKARNPSKVHLFESASGRPVKSFLYDDIIVVKGAGLDAVSDPDPAAVKEPEKKFMINGVEFSYGELISIGDFYQSPNDVYAASTAELTEIRRLMKQQAVTQDVEDAEWDAATGGRYLRLALKNASHFAPPDPSLAPPGGGPAFNHQSRWEVLHRSALLLAQDGKKERALVHNAFADHFLTDAFAAGHLVNKRDVMAGFRRSLAGNADAFLNRVAALAWADPRTPARMRLYETNNLAGLNFDSLFMFTQFLAGIEEKRPDVVDNTIAKTVHDDLNTSGVEVKNARNEQWVMKGDDHLNDPSHKSQQIALRAVAQSQANVLNQVGKPGAIDLAAKYKAVWAYVPRPTASGSITVVDAINRLSDSTQATAVTAAANALVTNLQTILNVAVLPDPGPPIEPAAIRLIPP